jgi:hypothetical protein
VKIAFVFILTTATLSCNNNGTTSGGSIDTSVKEIIANQRDPNHEHWKLTPAQGLAMRRASRNCNQFQIREANALLQIKVDSAFPFDKYERGWYTARHIATNVAEYARLRGMTANDARAKVNGYCTQLYMLWPKLTGTEQASFVPDTTYFDLITICPPPDDCIGILDTLKNDTLKPEN